MDVKSVFLNRFIQEEVYECTRVDECGTFDAQEQAERIRKFKQSSSHPTGQIIENPNVGVQTRGKAKENLEEINIPLISQIEPKLVGEALEDQSWIKTMEDELC